MEMIGFVLAICFSLIVSAIAAAGFLYMVKVIMELWKEIKDND